MVGSWVRVFLVVGIEGLEGIKEGRGAGELVGFGFMGWWVDGRAGRVLGVLTVEIEGFEGFVEGRGAGEWVVGLFGLVLLGVGEEDGCDCNVEKDEEDRGCGPA
eukprot:TRINITY_DN41992_c0_g1_i2.p3 TRINITY_DN41992_c0_g1~~TRINITY_DN41992_c0_g1_i2.p3  ORF type:complete len:104 (-),score=22.80 TRINITY_DN41992_c0_g1_i2:164-475(-)